MNQALQSIQQQHYQNLEIICIDDASDDNSYDIVCKAASEDSRIKVLRNASNLGISRTLNKAISAANGKFIARMDGDDIALPERIAIQMSWLDQNPSLQIVGSWTELFGARTGIYHYRLQSQFIKALFLFQSNGFPHYSILVRKALYDKYRYNPNFDGVEDTELWCRIIKSEPTINFTNVPKVLSKYRQHEQQTSALKSDLQRKLYRAITESYIQFFFPREIISEREFRLHYQLLHGARVDNIEEVVKVGEWVLKLNGAFNKIVGDNYLVIDEKWWHFCRCQNSVEATDMYSNYAKSSANFSFLTR